MCGTAALGFVRLGELPYTAEGGYATCEYRFIHRSMLDRALREDGRAASRRLSLFAHLPWAGWGLFKRYGFGGNGPEVDRVWR
jgi:hypothetical protein